VTYLALEAFEGHGVVGAFSTRLGGSSPAPYDTLNLGTSVGDDSARVTGNRFAFWQAAGVDPDMVVKTDQVHSDRVARVGRQDAGGVAREADALITCEPGVVLTAYFADCTPIFYLDPARRAVGLAHAGWRGTVKGIAERVVQRMTEEFGTAPGDLIVAIGPSIGPCCYEVDEDVAVQAERAFPGGGVLSATRGKWILDLWRANEAALLRAGVKRNNIVRAGLCTACLSHLFFSHRRDGRRTGRMGAVLSIAGRGCGTSR